MKHKVCAIFDIGRNEKKITLYDEHFKLVHEAVTDIPPLKDEDGFSCEDIKGITEWILTSFEKLVTDQKIVLAAVNFTSYGGAMVHLDHHHRPISPVYDVMKPLPYGLEKEFYTEVIKDNNVPAATGSPFLGMLNAGVQLFWLKKKKPKFFKEIVHSLFLPQYGHFLLTGKIVADYSSLQCHSMLWEHEKQRYHPWIEEQGITSLPRKTMPFRSADKSEKYPDVLVGVGVQASVAAMVPYLSILEPFVLSSSRNWTINSNPFAHKKLTDRQLASHLFVFNVTDTKQVQAARLYASNEHDRQMQHLATYFKKPIDYHKSVVYDPQLVWQLRNRFLQATPDTADARLLLDCPFVERNMNNFDNYEEAYHQFMMDLVAQQVASLRQVLGNSKIRKIIFDGNFNKNKFYMQLLNEAFFDKLLYVNEDEQSSSLGAAMVIAPHWTEIPKGNVGVSLRRV